MRILVDTNVFLEFFLDREKTKAVKDFFLNCHRLKNDIYISSMSLRDIEYTAHKTFHDKTIAKKVQMGAYKIASKVLSISSSDAIESIYSDVDDYEDALLVEAAKREMLNLIVTINKKDFVNAGFPVFSPEEFNDAVRKIME